MDMILNVFPIFGVFFM